ncbi:transcription antitermination factor NusB [Olsenella massiliensis]|uniref:transcription antitermination factor NusB n=1 Tax=Olsenella massiliensis TaxID=1622075 RepID=UPI00071C4698|nr:transcription antitermination factor NusB [Olsenella massiliensis]
MARLSDARRVALSLVVERRLRGARMRELMRGSAALDALGPRDRAFATRLAFGAVLAEGLVRRLIEARRRPGVRLRARVRDALSVSAFELLYLSTPTDVCVSQGTELARRADPHAADVAHALLRALASHDLPVIEAARGRVAAGGDDEGDLALVAAVPPVLVRELVASRGRPFARELLVSLSEPAPVYVAANHLVQGDDEAARLLDAAGLDPRPVGMGGSFALGRPAGLARSGLVDDGRVVPADLSSQLVAAAAAPAPGESLLEVGQGRATKTLLMESCAHVRGGLARIHAIDASPFKVDLARARLGRLGLGERVSCQVLDGRKVAEGGLAFAPEGGFDAAFVDAPCTGVGTLRRHPEAVWSLAGDALGEALRSLGALQTDLLRAAATRVRRGGTLVFATCSPLRHEDEDVIRAFLASPEGGDFFVRDVLESAGLAALGPRAVALARDLAGPIDLEGCLCVRQRSGGPDAHFCARLVRGA